eukprot:gene28070-13159_t
MVCAIDFDGNVGDPHSICRPNGECQVACVAASITADSVRGEMYSMHGMQGDAPQRAGMLAHMVRMAG